MDTYTMIKAADRVIRDHDIKVAELKTLQHTLQAKRKERDDLIPENAMLEEVRVFLQLLAEVARKEMMDGLQTAATLGLQFVFGPDLSFEIEVDTKRNNTAIEFYVVDKSGPEIVRLRPEDSMGGGVLDPVSLGMRYGLLKVRKPKPIGPMILDEPAKMVSSDLVPNIGMLIKSLTKIFEKQTILITHHEALMDADRTIFFRKVSGVTVCETARITDVLTDDEAGDRHGISVQITEAAAGAEDGGK